jgi:hypothetical protein
LWDPKKPGRVSESFLELLNRESASLSGRLQNPANWAAIQAEAAQLRNELPVGGYVIGPGEVLSQAEYEALFSGPSPAAAQQPLASPFDGLFQGMAKAGSGPARPEVEVTAMLVVDDADAAELIALPLEDTAEARLSFRQRCIRMGRRMLEALRP